jgi:hypothetical protein
VSTGALIRPEEQEQMSRVDKIVEATISGLLETRRTGRIDVAAGKRLDKKIRSLTSKEADEYMRRMDDWMSWQYHTDIAPDWFKAMQPVGRA